MNNGFLCRTSVRLSAAVLTAAAALSAQQFSHTSTQPSDPGVRAGAAGAGAALAGLSAAEQASFAAGLGAFQEVDDVSHGLGPRFNLDSCAGCHAFPSIGGASPALNPQAQVATKMGATNQLPPFITSNGPI